MKKQFSDIGLEDLALVGGGCGRKQSHCKPCPPPCPPNPCGPKKSKMTMETAPETAELATIPGAPDGDVSIDISIGGVSSTSAQTLPGADGVDYSTSSSLPGSDISIAT